MALIVKKFGGSSVGSTEKIMNVAKRVLNEKKPGDQIVMVVSAMGDTTDDLIKLAEGINKEPYTYPREMDMLNRRTDIYCIAGNGFQYFRAEGCVPYGIYGGNAY